MVGRVGAVEERRCAPSDLGECVRVGRIQGDAFCALGSRAGPRDDDCAVPASDQLACDSAADRTGPDDDVAVHDFSLLLVSEIVERALLAVVSGALVSILGHIGSKVKSTAHNCVSCSHKCELGVTMDT